MFTKQFPKMIFTFYGVAEDYKKGLFRNHPPFHV